MTARHLMLPSPAMGRRVHLWCYGETGRPLLVFPSAAGIAHEWQHGGMIDALAPLLAAGKLKIYCPESNVSETWRGEGSLAVRMAKHRAYERFILETLVPFIREDCQMPNVPMLAAGCSVGAYYTALFCLKHPETFRQGLCLSGRYGGARLMDDGWSEELYLNDPLQFLPNLDGVELQRVRQNTHLVVVVGQGAFENGCIPETQELGRWLARKRIPHHLALWGSDARHDYTWWRRQVAHYIPQVL